MPCLRLSLRFWSGAPVVRFIRLLILVVLPVMTAWDCQAQGRPKKRPDPTSWIVFERVDTSGINLGHFPSVDIFVMDQNGHQLRRLTSDHRSHNPSWSPNGRQIAFLSEQRKPVSSNTSDEPFDDFMAYRDFMRIPREVHRMDADGRNSSLVASVGTDAQDVFWLPDGKRFGVRLSDRGALHVMADTSGRLLPGGQQSESLSEYLDKGTPQPAGIFIFNYQTLLEWVPPVDNFTPTFVASKAFEDYVSPEILESVQSFARNTSSILVIYLDGSRLSFPDPVYDISWSLDGKHAAYSTFSGRENSVLYVTETQGDKLEGNRRALTDQSLDAHGPSWSSDGTRIAFMGFWRGTSQVFTIGNDGANLVQLSGDPEMSCYHPSWSPDGKWIVADCRKSLTVMRPLTSEVGGIGSIYLFDVGKPGRKPRQLTKCIADLPLSSSTCGARNRSFAAIPVPTP